LIIFFHFDQSEMKQSSIRLSHPEKEVQVLEA
jgi:hypothetical protein